MTTGQRYRWSARLMGGYICDNHQRGIPVDLFAGVLHAVGGETRTRLTPSQRAPQRGRVQRRPNRRHARHMRPRQRRRNGRQRRGRVLWFRSRQLPGNVFVDGVWTRPHPVPGQPVQRSGGDV